MATRSLIGYVTKEGNVRGTYCHWDGYPAYQGNVLDAHYNTPEVVEQLVQFEISNISTGGTPEYLNDGHEGPREWDSPSSFLEDFDLYGTEYNYLLTEDGWMVSAEYDEMFQAEHTRFYMGLNEVLAHVNYKNSEWRDIIFGDAEEDPEELAGRQQIRSANLDRDFGPTYGTEGEIEMFHQAMDEVFGSEPNEANGS